MEGSFGHGAARKGCRGFANRHRLWFLGVLDGSVASYAGFWPGGHSSWNCGLPIAGNLRDWTRRGEIKMRTKRLCYELVGSQTCFGDRRRSKTVAPGEREPNERLSGRFPESEPEQAGNC